MKADAAAGNASARAELHSLKRASKESGINLLDALKYERSRMKVNGSNGADDDEFHDPADQAVEEERATYRTPIVDFNRLKWDELDALCDHFGAALVWAAQSRPGLLQMGARWIAIIKIMRPQLIGGMTLPVPKQTEMQLKIVLHGRDPRETGEVFWLALRWVRDCTSLAQLGQRGWSLIYAMRQSAVGSITCEEIGAFQNKTRQAPNKLVQDFRDTFSGLKNLAMRGEETRKKCREAQKLLS